MAGPIDPRALRTFGAVCRAGSISGAARALGISQPSVSNTIATLEARLGAVLFARSRSGISLTAEGTALKRRAQALESLLEGAAADVAMAHRGIAGPLRVGGTPGALASLLPRAIARIEAEVARVALTVEERSDGELVEMLRRGEIELAFVTTEIEEPPPDIIEATLARDPFALLVGRSHDNLVGPVSLHALEDLRWVLPEARGGFRRQISAMFVAAEVPEPADAIRCDSLLATKAIVRTTDRVTILPREVAAAEIASGMIRALPIVEGVFVRNIGVRMLAGVALSPLARSMIETLSDDA